MGVRRQQCNAGSALKNGGASVPARAVERSSAIFSWTASWGLGTTQFLLALREMEVRAGRPRPH